MAEEEPVHKRVLNRCREALVEDIDFDYLISKEIFPSTRMRDIKEEKFTSEKNRKLIEAVAAAGPQAYDAFLKGLRSTQRHLYDVLKTEEMKIRGKELKTPKRRTAQGNQTNSVVTDNAAQRSLQRDSAEGSTNIDSARPDENYQQTMQHPVSASSGAIKKNVARDVTDSSQLPSTSNASDIADGSPVVSANTLGQEVIQTQSVQSSDNPRPSSGGGPASEPLVRTGTSKPPDSLQPRDVADGPTYVPESQAQNSDPQEENLRPVGNFSSYRDMHEDDRTQSIHSKDKQRYYTEGAANQTAVETGSLNTPSGISSDASNRPDTDQQESDDKGVSHSQDQPDARRLPPKQPHDSGSAINPQQGTSSGAPNRPDTIREEAGDNGMPHSQGLPDPPLSPSAQPHVSGPAINQIQQRMANLTSDESSDDYLFLKEHFDACVIYTQGNRNRAEEIVVDISRLPGDFKVCQYDDEEYFGFFTPESKSSVIINHCSLLLIVISEDIDKDRHAKYLRNTIAMARKNSARIQLVLFSKEEEKYIPKSLSNTNIIPWYDKENEYMKRYLLAILKQCKTFRKWKERKEVTTQKDVSHPTLAEAEYDGSISSRLPAETPSEEAKSTKAYSSKLPTEILRMDNRSVELYRKALENGKEKNYSVRIMVTGPCGVGKSTFTKRLLYQDVDINERNSTDGIEVHLKKCKVSLQTTEWIIEHTDERNDNTVERLVKLLESSSLNDREDTTDVPVVFPLEPKTSNDEVNFSDQFENKTDLKYTNAEVNKCRDSDAGKDKSDRHSDGTGDLSDVNEMNRLKHEQLLMRDLKEVISNAGKEDDKGEYADITIWDFGGQSVFYTTHQMFLSHRAIYILINNMSQHIKDVVIEDETYFDCSGTKDLKIEDFIDIWLNSIHGQSKSDRPGHPPVILVGTHADKLKPETREEQIDAIFDAIRNRFVGKDVSRHFIDKDFGLRNDTVDDRMAELRQTIIDVAQKQPYWGEEKPAKWIPLEKLLVELRRKGVEIMSRSEVEQLSKNLPVPITGDEELELFLHFQHETGNIMYFSVPELQNKIVLSPQFLVNALKSLVTAEMFCKKKPEIHGKWKEFRQTGILKNGLLDAVWNREENRKFGENRAHILALMEHLNIIAKCPEVEETGSDANTENDSYYLAPCMLRNSPPENVFHCNDEFTSTPCLCLILENVAFPSAIFNRLLVGCIQCWPIAKSEKKYCLYCGCGQFDIDLHHRLTLVFRSNAIGLRITKYSKLERDLCTSFCRDVKKKIRQILERIGECLSLTLKFEESVLCPHSEGDSMECRHSIEKLRSLSDFQCRQHAVDVMLQSCDLLKYWFDSEAKSNEASGDFPPGAAAAFDTKDQEDLIQLSSVKSKHPDAVESQHFDTPITNEHINHMRICIALVKVGANGLRDILASQLPTGYTDFYKILLANEARLRGQTKQFRPNQLQILYPDPRGRFTGTLDQFDITLLYALTRNINPQPVTPPVTGWGKKPDENPRDTTLGASVERIRELRNTFQGHSPDNKVDKKLFMDTWVEICQCMADIETVIGDHGYQNDLKEILSQRFSDKELRLLQREFDEHVDDERSNLESLEKNVLAILEQIKTRRTNLSARTLEMNQ